MGYLVYPYNKERMISISSYAKENDKSVRTIQRMIRSGKLNTIKKGSQTYIVDRSATGATEKWWRGKTFM